MESWSAGEKLIAEYLKEVSFDSVAVWARSLTNKAGIETGNQGHVAKTQSFFPGRVFADILTLGLGEISRATAGNSNHWAFVAKSANLDPQVSLL